MSASRGRVLALRAAALAMLALLLLAARRLDVGRVASELAHARPSWIVLALTAYLVILPLWAAQWWLLAPPASGVTGRRMLGVVALTSSVLNTTPLLVGEAAGIYLLIARGGLTRSAAVAVLAMDQLLVGVAKIFVLTTAALLLPLPGWMIEGVRGLALMVGLLFALLMTVAWSGARADRLAERLLRGRLAAAVGRVRISLAPLRSPRRGGAAFALALAKKGAELLAILAIQHAFSVTLSPWSAVLVLAMLNLATLMPVVPGNVGVFEAAVTLAYVHLGVPAERALGMAVVQHACYFAALALPGYRWLGRVPREAPAVS